jgi:hypothetical protein
MKKIGLGTLCSAEGKKGKITYLAEFIQRADAPATVGFNAHDLL